LTILRGPWPKTQEEARVQRQFQDIVDAELRDALRKQGETDAEVRERVRRWKLKRWGKATMFWLIAWLGMK
jgi:hypothetical protein